MNPDAPGAYSPPVDTHGSLIGALHRAIADHPHPARKASYGKMLAQALADQAAEHAAAQTPGGAAAGNPQGGPRMAPGAEAVGPTDGGYVDRNLTPLQVILTAAGGTANMHPAVGGWLSRLLAQGAPDVSHYAGLY